MTIHSRRVVIAFATATLLAVGCMSEEERWRAAESSKSIAAYQAYLRNYPQGEHSSQARSRLSSLTDNARIVIEGPSSLESQDNYRNISGPVWVFTIRFLELSGTETKIRQKQMRIFATDGTVWGDNSYVDIYDTSKGTTTIDLSRYGTDSYTSWVNSPNCQLCGAKMVLDYAGEDANGQFVSVSTSFVLQK